MSHASYLPRTATKHSSAENKDLEAMTMARDHSKRQVFAGVWLECSRMRLRCCCVAVAVDSPAESNELCLLFVHAINGESDDKDDDDFSKMRSRRKSVSSHRVGLVNSNRLSLSMEGNVVDDIRRSLAADDTETIAAVEEPPVFDLKVKDILGAVRGDISAAIDNGRVQQWCREVESVTQQLTVRAAKKMRTATLQRQKVCV